MKRTIYLIKWVHTRTGESGLTVLPFGHQAAAEAERKRLTRLASGRPIRYEIVTEEREVKA